MILGGLARKDLSLCLRDCLYTIYLRDAYSLLLAEPYSQVPLDSLTGTALPKGASTRLPRWGGVRALTPKLSDE